MFRSGTNELRCATDILHLGTGLDAETFMRLQLAGELFLLTSFFIEPKGCRFES